MFLIKFPSAHFDISKYIQFAITVQEQPPHTNFVTIVLL